MTKKIGCPPGQKKINGKCVPKKQTGKNYILQLTNILPIRNADSLSEAKKIARYWVEENLHALKFKVIKK